MAIRIAITAIERLLAPLHLLLDELTSLAAGAPDARLDRDVPRVLAARVARAGDELPEPASLDHQVLAALGTALTT